MTPNQDVIANCKFLFSKSHTNQLTLPWTYGNYGYATLPSRAMKSSLKVRQKSENMVHLLQKLRYHFN